MTREKHQEVRMVGQSVLAFLVVEGMKKYSWGQILLLEKPAFISAL